jgi:hypothetical protein
MWPMKANVQASARRLNLVRILQELRREGIDGLGPQAEFLGLTDVALSDVLIDAEIPDSLARTIEWSVNKPFRWLDADHSDDPLA